MCAVQTSGNDVGTSDWYVLTITLLASQGSFCWWHELAGWRKALRHTAAPSSLGDGVTTALHLSQVKIIFVAPETVERRRRR